MTEEEEEEKLHLLKPFCSGYADWLEQLFSHVQLVHPAVHPQLFSAARQKGKARVMAPLFNTTFEPINETAGESFLMRIL